MTCTTSLNTVKSDKTKDPLICLQHAIPLSVGANTLKIRFHRPGVFHRDLWAELESYFQSNYGKKVYVSCIYKSFSCERISWAID